MSLPLAIIALLILVPAAVAMALRNLIHSALLLIASWAGIAAFYLWAGAQFVAFAQVLVYVGAVSMVVLFAVLLTRHSRLDASIGPGVFGRVFGAVLCGGGVMGVVLGGVLSERFKPAAQPTSGVTVRQIGDELMQHYTIALLITGILLTVALLGAVVIAATDRREDSR